MFQPGERVIVWTFDGQRWHSKRATVTRDRGTNVTVWYDNAEYWHRREYVEKG